VSYDSAEAGDVVTIVSGCTAPPSSPISSLISSILRPSPSSSHPSPQKDINHHSTVHDAGGACSILGETDPTMYGARNSIGKSLCADEWEEAIEWLRIGEEKKEEEGKEEEDREIEGKRLNEEEGMSQEESDDLIAGLIASKHESSRLLERESDSHVLRDDEIDDILDSLGFVPRNSPLQNTTEDQVSQAGFTFSAAAGDGGGGGVECSLPCAPCNSPMSCEGIEAGPGLTGTFAEDSNAYYSPAGVGPIITHRIGQSVDESGPHR